MERRNVTFSLPRSLFKRAKMMTVRREETLSQFIREAIEEKVSKDTKYKKSREKHLKFLMTGFDLGTDGDFRLSKEKIHDRR